MAIGSLVSLSIFFSFGVISVLIPSGFFIRMTPVHFYDYILLVLTAALSGAFAGLWYYSKKSSRKCSSAATGGALGGFFAFGCAICNKLLVLVLGLALTTNYFMPFQPILGILSIILLSYAVYMQSKTVFRK